MKKNLLEWNAYIKLTEKKIKKLEDELYSEAFIVTTKGDLLLTKEDVEKRCQRITDITSSIGKLKANVEAVKSKRQYVNATSFITVGNEEMTVSTAIDRYLKREEMNKYINKIEALAYSLVQKEREALKKYNSEKEKIESQLVSMTRPASEKEKELAKERIEYNVPVVKDPINLGDRSKKQREKYEQFLSDVNVQLNVFNAKTEMEVDI